MTILDQIAREAKALPAKKRQEALRLLKSIRVRSVGAAGARKPVRKTLGKARPAIKAAKGMWRDRTDLPADTVEASIELRRRVMRRNSHG